MAMMKKEWREKVQWSKLKVRMRRKKAKGKKGIHKR
jgi:hypothetical protein